MREFMPKYFGFEGVGVLLYDNDKKGEWLFTDPNFGSAALMEDDKAKATKANMYDVEVDGDSGSDTEIAKRRIAAEEEQRDDPGNMTQDEKMERLNALHNAKIITFPVNQGISGMVFANGKLFKCNDAEKESNFSGDIDN